MNQKIHDFNSHLTTRSNEMGFWFVPVLRPNPNIFSNKNAQNHYSSSNIPPLKIPKRAFFRSPFKQSSASQLSTVWSCIQVHLIQPAKPRFMKNEFWNLSNGAPKKDSSYLCGSYSHNCFFFFLPHKLDGTKRNFVSPLQQDKLLASRRNVGWPRPLFCGANLCDWEALPTGMNESGNKRRSGGGSGGQGIAGEVGALEGASFHATSFPSRCLPVPVCSRQSGHTRAAVNHHPHFTKSHLLTTLPLPWLHPERESALIALVFCGSEKNQPAQGWAYPGLLYPSAQPINQ